MTRGIEAIYGKSESAAGDQAEIRPGDSHDLKGEDY